MENNNDLIFFYQQLRQHGLNDSHSGNASIRTETGYIITETGACADTINEEGLIPCALNRPPDKKASLDAAIHCAIYQNFENCHAVLHAHNPHTIALTLDNSHFSPIDFEGQLYFGRLPVVDCEPHQYLSVMPERIVYALEKHEVAIVRSHGVYAKADRLELAYKWLCSLEQSAKIKWLHSQLK